MDISIVVPVYNERENLPRLLSGLEGLVLSAPCAMEVILVDDGSTDGSVSLLREEPARRPWLKLLFGERNQGMGAALKKGTAQARHPLVAWVMADCSDRLSDVLEMRRKLMDGAELVVASRAAAGGSYGDLVGLKALGSRGYSRFSCLLLGLPVNDITNAFRAFRREVLAGLALQRDDFAISPEMVIKAVQQGRRVTEVPTTYYYRRRGISSFAVLRMGLVYFRLTICSWLARLGGVKG